MNYKIIKSSGFVFQNPEQHRAFEKMKSKFENDCYCGLELVALRRTNRRRRRGSIGDVASMIYDLIQQGEHDFVKPLNLNRWAHGILSTVEQRKDEINRQRIDANRRLFDLIDTRNLHDDGLMVGYFVTSDHMVVVEFHEAEPRPLTFPGGRATDAEIADLP